MNGLRLSAMLAVIIMLIAGWLYAAYILNRRGRIDREIQNEKQEALYDDLHVRRYRFHVKPHLRTSVRAFMRRKGVKPLPREAVIRKWYMSLDGGKFAEKELKLLEAKK